MTQSSKWILSFLLPLGMVFSAQAQSDQQIADIVQTANEAEIDAAKYVKDKVSNPEVRSYAEHMIVEHTQNNKDAKELSKKINVKPEGNDTSKALKQDAKNKMAELKKMKGADLEKTYIQQQVAMHRQLLDDLNQKLLPAAANPQMREHLTKTRDHVQSHLTKAEALQSTLTK